MTVLIKIIQLILSLSLLVIVHEFGRFITARIFKTRVTKFYIFFDPKFSLFKCKRFNGIPLHTLPNHSQNEAIKPLLAL